MFTRLMYVFASLLAYGCMWAIGWEAMAVWETPKHGMSEQLLVIELLFVFGVLSLWFSMRSLRVE